MNIKYNSFAEKLLRRGSELRPGTIFKAQGWFFVAFVNILLLTLLFARDFPSVLKSESKRQENAGVELRLIEAELSAMSEAINFLIYRQESGTSDESSSTFLPYLEIIDLHRGIVGYRAYGRRNPHLWLDALVKPTPVGLALLEKMLVNKKTYEQNPERYAGDEIEFITLTDRIKKNLILPPNMLLDPEAGDNRTVGQAVQRLEELLAKVGESQTNILLNLFGLYDAKNKRAVDIESDAEVLPDLNWAKATFYENQAVLDRAEISKLIVLLSKANNNQVLRSIEDKAELYELFLSLGVVIFICLIAAGGLLMYLLLRSFSEPLNRVERILSGGNGAEVKGSVEMFNKLDELSREMTISATLRGIAKLLVQRNTEAQERKVAEAKAQQISSAMRDSLKHISHEIGNPLAAASGHIRQMKMKDATRVEDTARLEIIRRQFGIVTDLVDNVLLLQRMEDGELELRKETFSIVESIVQKMNAVEHLAKDHSISLMLDMNCPHINNCDMVIADKTRLGQIWYNLLANAVKFTKESARREVSVSIRSTPMKSLVKFEVRVKDTGIGMKPEVVKQLGRQFMQASPDIQTRFGGTGLGISIVSKLVKAFQGTMVARSTFGEGTEFILSFTLPTIRASHGVKNSEVRAKRLIVIDSVSQGNRRSSAAGSLAAAGHQVEHYSASAFSLLSIAELGDFDNILVSQDCWESLQTTERQLFQQIQSASPGALIPVYPYLSTAEAAALSGAEGLYHPLTPAQVDKFFLTHDSKKVRTLYNPAIATAPDLLNPIELEAPSTEELISKEFEGMSVLLVDDSPAVLSFMAEDLRQMGVVVKTASNADEALSQLQRYISLNRALSLILTDFQMDPEGESAKTGLWLASRVRAVGGEIYGKTPIVLFTGNQGFLTETQMQEAKRLNLFGITDKGFNLEKLAELLRRVRDNIPYEIEPPSHTESQEDSLQKITAPSYTPKIKGARFKSASLVSMGKTLKESRSSFELAAMKGRALDFAGEAHAVSGVCLLVFSDERYRSFFKSIEEKFKDTDFESSAELTSALGDVLPEVLRALDHLEMATQEALQAID